MTSSRRPAVLGLVLLVATSLLAWGQGGQGRPPQGREGYPGPLEGLGAGGPGGPPDPVMGLAGRILHDLNLSEPQKRQIHSLLRSHVDGDLKPLIQDFFETRHNLENVVWNPAATDKDVTTAADALSQASLALEKGRRRLATDVMRALTESQRQSFHEMLTSAKPPMPLAPSSSRGPGPPPEDDPETGR